MKSFIALCFLAAMCAMQASADSPSDKFKDEVDTIKKTVGLTVASLRRTKYSLTATANQQMNTLRSQSISTIENIAKPAVAEIRVKVEAAKVDGKDVEHCYTAAQGSLHSILEAAYSGIGSCQTKGRIQLHQAFTPLDAGMTIGQAYMHQLDFLIPECDMPDATEMQTCIADKLGKINESVTSYQAAMKTQILNAPNGVNNVINGISPCITETVPKARSATNDLTTAADKCIAN